MANTATITATIQDGSVIESTFAEGQTVQATIVSGGIGATGPQGPAGTNGTNGTNGVGVPAGGTTGQLLSKNSNTDYDTEWTTINLDELFQDTDITYTVGSGGQYATVNEAIEDISRLRSVYKNNGFTATISLLSGFTMAEQVFVRSIDLSWITITSVDAEVPVTTAAITQELINEEDITPIFGATDNASLPILDVLFAYPDAGAGYATSPKDGIMVTHNSHVLFKPGAGVKRARFGLKVLYGSSATCYMPGLTQGGAGSGAGTVTGVDFSYSTDTTVQVAYGSKANLARSLLHHGLGPYGVYVIWASHVDLYQSQINDTINGNAITCRDGSYANMRETTVARSVRGYHALHNSRINARNHSNMWSTDSAKNCTDYGILASYNSHIDASEVDVSGSTNGANASNASSVNFDIGFANNCSVRGISAVQGSTINAQGTPANNCGTGFYAETASTINAAGTTANTCSIGYHAYFSSTINADSTSATSCTTDGYRADETSTMQARSSSANGATVNGFNANRGSRINARGATATGCATGFIAFEGSSINAQSTTASTASVFGYTVDRGSEINAGSRTGTTNQTVNVRTGKGLISDAVATNGDGQTAVWGQITGTLSSQTDLQTALNAKEPTITAGTTAQYWRGDKSWQTLDKSAVGLSNVDNTSDATKNSASVTLTNKTISGSDNTISNIAESSVTNLTSDLATKAPLASPTFTGTPAAPTATAGTNTTQLATTAFVAGAVSLLATDSAVVHLTGDESIAGVKTFSSPPVFPGLVMATGSYDLNNFVNDGDYLFTTGATLTNAPHSNGYLVVISANPVSTSGQNNNVKQIWYRMGTNGTNDMNTLVRQRNGGSWGAWVQFLVTGDAVDLTTNQTIAGNKTFSGTTSLTGPVAFATGGLRSTPVLRTAATVTLSASSAAYEFCDATSNVVAITLPAANAASGQLLTFKKIDASANAITITRAGADTIDGATSYSLLIQYKYVTVQSDGTSKWFVIGNN